MACPTCCNTINVDNIHACKTESNALSVESLIANNICVSQELDAKLIQAENEVANTICAQKIQAKEAWEDKTYINTLCAQSASIDTLCVNNLTSINQTMCNVYRAAVTFNMNQTYTLGTPINWNVILDDPSSDVSLSPFAYTVEAGQGGYYLLSYHLNVQNLQGSDVIAGTPISVLTVYVNGNELRSEYAPFLAFSSVQKSTLTSLCLLNAGDVVTMDYKIMVFTGSGLIPFVGTVTIDANGSFAGQSGFAIIQQSTLCSNSGGGGSCPVCPVVNIPCSPVVNPCQTVAVPCCTPGMR